MGEPRVIEVARSSEYLRKRGTWEQLLAATAEVMEVKPSLILGRSRQRRHARARHLLCYLARRHTEMTLEEIATRLGGRDHTTIHYAIRQVQEDREIGPYVRRIEDKLATIGGAAWTLELVDTGEGPPGLRVLYRREDGTEWGAALIMHEIRD